MLGELAKLTENLYALDKKINSYDLTTAIFRRIFNDNLVFQWNPNKITRSLYEKKSYQYF